MPEWLVAVIAFRGRSGADLLRRLTERRPGRHRVPAVLGTAADVCHFHGRLDSAAQEHWAGNGQGIAHLVCGFSLVAADLGATRCHVGGCPRALELGSALTDGHETPRGLRDGDPSFCFPSVACQDARAADFLPPAAGAVDTITLRRATRPGSGPPSPKYLLPLPKSSPESCSRTSAFTPIVTRNSAEKTPSLPPKWRWRENRVTHRPSARSSRPNPSPAGFALVANTPVNAPRPRPRAVAQGRRRASRRPSCASARCS